MPGPFVLTKDLIDKMAREAAKRVNKPGDDAEYNEIRAERILDGISPEELIVRGVVASLKRGEGGKS
ncbi:MAG: hypothetical protein AUJ31_02460 [Parcubacteria group bacterium CG1_02_39_15]|uniref:Uncharacterized protein n=4 Tax=Candidatus Nealsoniibacteriota TaxID=1817911 RepID=A0A2G9YSR5_9BACT|nr:MAG: hypothetical protein AUJ31_02460 [Parcubacteria group bacterium CG1_02_39_15]PIP22257.1 MAG: hypothetical protein COX38_01550 [Candidatus Nealsonbacteria bacterium CG23_combo_of_CG06-09_8_20_14_all_39_25]PIQ98354.1 MAG: hypothetical protein COV64_01670 [Candidatus Nealsonbacteria bacterium CG11_big_fil_rev_8_21_14_0_20_39_9]PIW90510.1 MAG: hypothetical protein COZ92_00480 [Candidatus Nealsonbacteria bacterium CG_4_8_14_3_um_filter_40_11]PIZ88066.1 MAG: hypothetical protein COX91_02100 [